VYLSTPGPPIAAPTPLRLRRLVHPQLEAASTVTTRWRVLLYEFLHSEALVPTLPLDPSHGLAGGFSPSRPSRLLLCPVDLSRLGALAILLGLGALFRPLSDYPCKASIAELLSFCLFHYLRHGHLKWVKCEDFPLLPARR